MSEASEGGYSDSEVEERAAARPAKRQKRGGARAGGGAGAGGGPAAPRLKPFTPPPPAQPISPADFSGLLHGCPRLMGARAVFGCCRGCRSNAAPPAAHPPLLLLALLPCPCTELILETNDGLRTVSLVARDAASLSIALGARAGQGVGAELWRTLAAGVAPASLRVDAGTPVDQGEGDLVLWLLAGCHRFKPACCCSWVSR